MKNRILLLLSFLILFVAARSQQLLTDQFPVSDTGSVTACNAVIYLPPGYTKDKSYPLVIYSHGIAQAGTDIAKLYTTGLPKVLKDGYRPSFDFIMIAPQSPSYGIAPQWLEGLLQKAQQRWKIDTNRIYLTGIDAGGWAAYGSQLNMNASFAKKIAAIVTISAATQNVNKEALDWWKSSATPLWSLVGELDKSYLDQNTILVNALNKAVPGVATLTVQPGVGHAGWDAVYTGKVMLDGKTIWEWLYQFDRSKTFSKPHITAKAALATTAANKRTTTATNAKIIQVNIYGGANAYTNAAWNNWNVGTDNANNLNSDAFNYTDGTTSGVSALLSTTRNVMDNADDYGSGMAPAEVLRYTSCANTARTLTISGLSPNKTYDLELYASRNAYQNYTTIFTINGVTQTINTYNNLSNKAAFTSLSTGEDGQISVSLSNSNGYNYINGFTLTESSAAQTTPTVGASGAHIEAEDYTAMYGVRTQPTSDVGGGENVGWIDNGDWMDYKMNVITAGKYAVKLRLASQMSGAQFQIKDNSGAVLTTVTVPNTGDYQSWTNVNATITLPAGTQTVRLQSSATPYWNINWFELNLNTSNQPGTGTALYTGARIEAEDYTDHSGILVQPTRDFAGGNQNTYNVNNGDWLSYAVNAPAAGAYTLCLRVACAATGSQFQIKSDNGTILSTVSLPNTNAWQVWQDLTTVINLDAGAQTLRFQSISNSGWNLNYFEVVKTPLNAFASYTLRRNSGPSIYLPLGLNLANLNPGDTLNIPGGDYNVIDLGNFKGNASNPIIIQNRNGQVNCTIIRLSSTPEYFKLLGNGDPNITYGFKIDGGYNTGSCLTAFGSNFEIAYVEGMHSNSGFFIKKNPSADDPQSQYPNYEMDNIIIDHNYLHDTNGEGMYIGHTAPDGGQGGNPLLPVRMRNVEIAFNRVDQTGWDGIQLSNATTGCTIHDNTVTNFGTLNVYAQQAGIILGGNTQGDVYNNTIQNGTGNGIQNFGFGLNKIYNNEVDNVGRNGTSRGFESIYCNDIIITSETRPKQQIQANNNTIKYPMSWGAIRVSGYHQNSLPATEQYNQLLLPNAPDNWEKLYFPTYVPNSIISDNTLITQ